MTGGAMTGDSKDSGFIGPEPGQPAGGQLMDWAFDQSGVRLLIFDREARCLRVNNIACRSLGLESEAAALGRRLSELSPDPKLASFEAAVRRAIQTGERAQWQGYGRAPGEDRERAWLVTISPVREGSGPVCGALTVTSDVTEHQADRDRLSLVMDASRRIGATLDVGRTAEELVELVVPRLADLAMIDVQDSVLRGDEPAPGPLSGPVPLRRMAFQSILPGAPEVVGRVGQVRVYPPGSPAVQALATGEPVLANPDLHEAGSWAVRDHGPGRSDGQVGFHSVMAVPLRARGTTFGVASFVRHEHPDSFAAADLALAGEIVARAAVCIDNARRYTREHATAAALQRSLLQRQEPDQGAVQVATRYLPGQAGAAVGGDWLDVIALSGSRVGLVAGDVAGHGIHAAATMGRLRTAVRTLADLDLEPEELLTRLDDVVSRIAEEHSETSDLNATCVFAVYDPITRCATMARAGHPPPAIMTPGCEPEFAELPAGPPLGVGGFPFEERQIELPENSILVLFTDGLVESREREIDDGLAAMGKVLATVDGQPADPSYLQAVCDGLVSELVPGRAGDDDAALLVARTAALPPDRVTSWDLPADPAIVAQARARAARQLAAWGLEELMFTTELLVSELVTNAIRHGEAPIQLRMILDTTLSCEVSDASVTAPRHRRADRYDEGGRGLMLVARLAGRWGTRYTAAGKTIWAQQPVPPGLGRVA
ncbi:MAG TPA: SpoIIE family protein phosphatase [Streptosporangiaceae bacterium]|nr:SpoIIE family protein phosphatase [Streptosporangiaceae bacterium]